MSVTIDTTTQVSAPGFSGQRKIAATSTGRLWTAVNSLADTRWEFWYSDDNGASWTENTAARVTYTTASTGSLFIDQDNWMHFAYVHGASAEGPLTYRRNNALSTSLAWSSASVCHADSGNRPDIVAHREGTGWRAHIAWVSNSNIPRWSQVAISAAGVVTPNLSATALAGFSSSKFAISLDFNHTGDGVTIAGSAPHLYFAFQVLSDLDLSFRKAVYSAGAWTLSTTRVLASLSTDVARVSLVFDGARAVVATVDPAAPTVILVRERDAADTTTTARNPPALTDGDVTGLSVTFDAQQDIYLAAVGTTSDDPKWVAYDRSAGTWNSWAAIEATTCADDSVSLRRAAGYGVDFLYATSATSPYTIKHERVSLNSAPNGAPWAVADGARDIDSTLLLDWIFSDPNPADTQLSYVLKRDIGGTIRYYEASGQTWETTEQTNVTATTSVTLAAGWGLDADANHLYYVKTTDAGSLTGPFGPALTITPSELIEPTLTEPDPGDTIATASVTLEWAVGEQSAYKATVYNETETLVLWTSGWVADTDARTVTSSTVLENLTTYVAEIQTRNLEGLDSTPVSSEFDVEFVAPAYPSITADASSNVYIDIEISNPEPEGDEPEVVYHDLFVKVATGGRDDGERLVGDPGVRIATNLAPNSTYRDWAVASGTNYLYRVVAFAENGTSSPSDWSDQSGLSAFVLAFL